MNIDKTPNAAQAERIIPQPPGGGAWRFDYDLWEWISKDPLPAPSNETPAAAVAHVAGPANKE